MSALDAVLVILAVAFAAGLVRAWIGPTLPDRAAAADLCFFSVVSALAVFAVRAERLVFLDAVVVATLVGFVATVSLGWLVGRRR